MEFERLQPHPFLEWRFMCEKSGLTYPWYTESCLAWLKTLDVSRYKVFEYGAGISTIWWKFNAHEVHGVDSNLEWANKTGVPYGSDHDAYISKPKTYLSAPYAPNKDKYDIIIIDGAFRDDCTEIALQCIKEGGYIIADNYHQDSACPASEWVKTDELMKDYPMVIFEQLGHPDWKTAVWQIVKK